MSGCDANKNGCSSLPVPALDHPCAAYHQISFICWDKSFGIQAIGILTRTRYVKTRIKTKGNKWSLKWMNFKCRDHFEQRSPVKFNEDGL